MSEKAEVERLRASMQAIERDLETERQLRREAQELSKEMQVNVLIEGSRWKAELDKYKEALLQTSTRSAEEPAAVEPQQDPTVSRTFDLPRYAQEEWQWQKESLRRSRTEAEAAAYRASSNSSPAGATYSLAMYCQEMAKMTIVCILQSPGLRHHGAVPKKARAQKMDRKLFGARPEHRN